MKSLREFIHESKEAQGAKKTFTFNFAGLENAEDTLKSLDGMGTVDGEKFTLEVDKDALEKSETAVDIIQQFINVAGKSGKRASDEAYAQKLVSFEKKMKEVNDFMAAEPEGEGEGEAEGEGEGEAEGEDAVKESKKCPKCGKEKCECKGSDCDGDECDKEETKEEE